jgi:hypothetical protein
LETVEPKLTPEEGQELRDWLAADEFAETDELIAAVDEGIRSAPSGSSLSIDEAGIGCKPTGAARP